MPFLDRYVAAHIPCPTSTWIIWRADALPGPCKTGVWTCIGRASGDGMLFLHTYIRTYVHAYIHGAPQAPTISPGAPQAVEVGGTTGGLGGLVETGT